jgi:hypothetical protein
VCPYLIWSVCQSRLDAFTVLGPILESSRLHLSVPRALHGSKVNGGRVDLRRGCLASSFLGDDIFPHGGVWSHAPAYGPQPPVEETRPTCKTSSGLVAVMGGGVCQGEGSFPGYRYLLEVSSSLVSVHRIIHSKRVLTRRCSSLGKIMMLFRRVP